MYQSPQNVKYRGVLYKSLSIITGVKLMTVIAITVIPRWQTWNRVIIFFVDKSVSIMYFKWHMHQYDSNL